jgi:hypothetical protein
MGRPFHLPVFRISHLSKERYMLFHERDHDLFEKYLTYVTAAIGKRKRFDKQRIADDPSVKLLSMTNAV